jgi:hypothetical protein
MVEFDAYRSGESLGMRPAHGTCTAHQVRSGRPPGGYLLPDRTRLQALRQAAGRGFGGQGERGIADGVQVARDSGARPAARLTVTVVAPDPPSRWATARNRGLIMSSCPGFGLSGYPAIRRTPPGEVRARPLSVDPSRPSTWAALCRFSLK